MAPDLPRRERRAGSRRAWRRFSKEKADKLFALIEEGHSRETIAKSLNYSVADIDRLLALAKPRLEESKAVDRGEGNR